MSIYFQPSCFHAQKEKWKKYSALTAAEKQQREENQIKRVVAGGVCPFPHRCIGQIMFILTYIVTISSKYKDMQLICRQSTKSFVTESELTKRIVQASLGHPTTPHRQVKTVKCIPQHCTASNLKL